MINIVVRIKEKIFQILDRIYLRIDKGQIRRSKNIALIPKFRMRRGGKVSYAEWAHVIGIFQALITQKANPGSCILDVGCGTGLMGIASFNIVQGKGKYVGLDVNEGDLNYCRNLFGGENYDFDHLDFYNATYAQGQQLQPRSWDINDESFDLVTALSVWTHFNESDAIFYMHEVFRVLKHDGIAIITFFLLDHHYEDWLENDAPLVLHRSDSFDWTFNKHAYESLDWRTTSWSSVPEDAIGVTENGLNHLLKQSGLQIEEYYPGSWKGYQGLYFQDILILKKNG